MCITNRQAELTKTKILSFPLDSGNHYLAYSNSVKNLSGEKNAMILPIPGETKQEWFFDTTAYNRYLKEIAQQTVVSDDYKFGIRSKGMSRGMLAMSKSMFEVGQYKVLITKDTEELRTTLAENGIPLTKALNEFFSKHYPNCTFVACLFDADTTIAAQPIAFEYKPNNPAKVFFPTMDSHDGNAPVKNEMVEIDHHIITTMDNEDSSSVTFSQEVPAFLNRKFGTYNLNFNDWNGDIYLDPAETEPNLKRTFEFQ